ncbi:hypothetical protein HDA32_002516 [Spinactinospora alkalitolerans]|uniref:Uncharacterized protein n=1 Tax=Spinactinospora alkalitolerans TaxID=687207 RepID=A0A852TSK9_9ACTN|nr:hypothetical protein [Spinactinospora alkalitolerans]NYE47396.1 hypothetical protein [Spinactinospora alkalitolerans]
MRHVIGFIIGLVLAPVILLASGWALPRFVTINGFGGTFVSFTGITALGALALLALVLACTLTAPRLTPLVPGIAGLTLVGVTAAHLLRPGLADRVPGLPGLEGALTLLPLGLYLPLALALIIPLFVPSRWQSYRPRGAHAAGEDEEYFEDLYDDDGDEAAPPRRRDAGAA